jgi:hypothetical protein
MENLHALLKHSNGKANLRPAWFFDIRQQGEGIADVGTHLVDLLFWTLFADKAIDYRRDVRLLQATRTPLLLTPEQFEGVTGEKAWPEFVRDAVHDGRLEYFTNNSALFTIRGVHVSLRSQWEYEAPQGVKDSYLAQYRGSRATVRLREGKAENFIPEVDVIPNSPAERGAVTEALNRSLERLRRQYPHLAVRESGGEIRVVISPEDRTKEDYFALLVERFLGFVEHPGTLPAWENSNMIAKYYITTKAVEMARGDRP